MLTKFDKQQFALMKQSIHSYENSEHSLDTLQALTQSIEKLLDSLKSLDNTWKETFRTEWWELEFTTSLMIDNDEQQLSEEDEDAVSTALTNMKVMIDQILAQEI